MTSKIPRIHTKFVSFTRLQSSLVTSKVPRTISELETEVGRLTYRNVNREWANYLLINKLILIHSVRDVIYSKPSFQDNKDLFMSLMSSSKYFNYRIYFYENFRNFDLNNMENFPNGFASTENEFDGDEFLVKIFDKYSKESSFEEHQILIMNVIQYLAQMNKRPTYKLYATLIENFSRLGLKTISNQIYNSITKLPGEITNFKSSDNYLCQVDDHLLNLMLKFVAELDFAKDFKKLVELIDINSCQRLHPLQSEKHLNPLTKIRVKNEFFYPRKDLPVLKMRFFRDLSDEAIYCKTGNVEIESKQVSYMTSETFFLYLDAAYKMRHFNIFQLLLRKLVFNSVITASKQLKIIVTRQSVPVHLYSYLNLQTVEDYSLLFTKDVLKLILKYCYTSKDAKCFKWIWNDIIKRAFMTNQLLYLKYTYPLQVIDNEIVSLIWLNCKNLDYEVHETWVLLAKIFELPEIFEDYQKEKFIAVRSK